MREILEKAAKIKLVIFDVDGVLTDGSLFLGDDGQEYKAFNSKDGHGFAMLNKTSIKIGIITGRTSEVVRTRMDSLKVEHVYQGQRDKRPAYHDLREKLGLAHDEVAYVGDDVVDLPIMTQVGLAITVADAHSMVIEHADWVTSVGGGKGAAREVVELLMDAQGLLEDELASYLK